MRSLLLIFGCMAFTGPALASSVIVLPLPKTTPSVIRLGTPDFASARSSDDKADDIASADTKPRKRYGAPMIIDGGTGEVRSQPVSQSPEASVPPPARSAPPSNNDDLVEQQEAAGSPDDLDAPARSSSVPEPVAVQPVSPSANRPL
ncbi:MAG TPA: hypothetical protein VGN98_07230 [Tianweitania sediminis]|jgi:hypothetical protein|nr:hypothetical protein [Tianweitania sediminis]